MKMPLMIMQSVLKNSITLVDYFTVNVSCPNIAGMDKLQDMDSLRIILNRLSEDKDAKKAI